MKKIFYAVMAMMTMGLCFSSCEKNKAGVDDPTEDVTQHSVTLTFDSITKKNYPAVDNEIMIDNNPMFTVEIRDNEMLEYDSNGFLYITGNNALLSVQPKTGYKLSRIEFQYYINTKSKWFGFGHYVDVYESGAQKKNDFDFQATTKGQTESTIRELTVDWEHGLEYYILTENEYGIMAWGRNTFESVFLQSMTVTVVEVEE